MNRVDPSNASPHEEAVLNRILTAANVISFVRLCLVPLYLVLLFNGHDIAATAVFSLAAVTDFLDGQVARRTHTVSKLGKLLDPAIDTILMVTGVLGVFLIGRLPLWIMVWVFARELFLLIGGAILLKVYRIQVPVIYPGKFATTFLFVGFAGLLLNMPLIPGLGICHLSWLPGFTPASVCWSIWFIYAGIMLQLGVTIYYCVIAWRRLKAARANGVELHGGS